MGLLGNILSGAVSDAIGKAVGEATKKVVTPVAERVAEKQAEVVDHLAKKAESAVDDAAAQAEAGGQAQAAPLTEEQKEQQKQALDALKGFSTMFSGAVAMAKKEAEEEEALRQAKEQAVFDNWEANLGQYPVWDVGGERFEIEEQTPMNGYPVWRLSLRGRPYLVELYAAKLRNAGFKAKGCANPLDLNADTYYKLIDGVCYAFNRSDAASDNWITVTFFVDKYVEPKPTRQEKDLAREVLGGLAKGLFKKKW